MSQEGLCIQALVDRDHRQQQTTLGSTANDQAMTTDLHNTGPLLAAHIDRLEIVQQGNIHVQVGQPVRFRREALDPVRIGEAAAQHLVAAAEPDQQPALPDVGGDVHVPALAAQVRQVRKRRLGARQQDQVRIPGQGPARLHHGDGDIVLGRQRVEVVEVGNATQPRHRHADRLVGDLRGHPAVEAHGVLLGQ